MPTRTDDSRAREIERRALEPSAIFGEIEARPPLVRERAKAAYLWKKIDWTLEFANGHKEPPGNVRLIFRQPGDIRMVAGMVALANYPWLQQARSGEMIRVRGRIAKIELLAIELEAITLMRTSKPQFPSRPSEK